MKFSLFDTLKNLFWKSKKVAPAPGPAKKAAVAVKVREDTPQVSSEASGSSLDSSPSDTPRPGKDLPSTPSSNSRKR
jgi:hypothetical protein